MIQRMAALLDPAGVPEAVLTSRAACDYICGSSSTGTPADQSAVRSVFDSLARVGLVTIDAECAPRTVRVHGAVQAASGRTANQAKHATRNAAAIQP